MERNGLVEDDIISIIFTATADVVLDVPGHRGPGHRVRRRAPAVRRRDPGARLHAPLHPGPAPRPHRPLRATSCATSTCTAPRGSAMTSPAEEPARQADGRSRPAGPVVGTGLIGGSLGLALRARGWHVTGHDRDPGRARAALAAGALDAVGDDLDAAVVFVATPPARWPPWPGPCWPTRPAPRRPGGDRRERGEGPGGGRGRPPPLRRRAPHGRLRAGRPGRCRPRPVRRGDLGPHPDRRPPTSTPSPGSRRVVGPLGADVVALAPEDHDRLVAVVSHVPHLVAATLMNAAARAAEEDAALLRLAAGGFRDMTRVAAGHPGIWPDICADNARAIVAALDQLLADLAEMRELVAAGGPRRRCWRCSNGPARPAGTCRPGPPGPSTWPSCGSRCPTARACWPRSPRLAGDLGINIYDIEIAHSAEGPRGVLVLVVAAAEAEQLRAGGRRTGLPRPASGTLS